jgi:hypothetical protein
MVTLVDLASVGPLRAPVPWFGECGALLRAYLFGQPAVFLLVVLTNAALCVSSSRGSIANARPRRHVSALLYASVALRVVEFFLLLAGTVAWSSLTHTTHGVPVPLPANGTIGNTTGRHGGLGPYSPCLGYNVGEAVIRVVLLVNWCFWGISLCWWFCQFSASGREAAVRARAQQRPNMRIERGGSFTAVIGQNMTLDTRHHRRWNRRLRCVFCLWRPRYKNISLEVAKHFARFFVDVDLVPWDTVAALALVSAEQRASEDILVEQTAPRLLGADAERAATGAAAVAGGGARTETKSAAGGSGGGTGDGITKGIAVSLSASSAASTHWVKVRVAPFDRWMVWWVSMLVVSVGVENSALIYGRSIWAKVRGAGAGTFDRVGPTPCEHSPHSHVSPSPARFPQCIQSFRHLLTLPPHATHATHANLQTKHTHIGARVPSSVACGGEGAAPPVID